MLTLPWGECFVPAALPGEMREGSDISGEASHSTLAALHWIGFSCCKRVGALL